MPTYLEKIKERFTWFGYSVSAGAGTFPASLPGRLVPLAKRLNWFGYAVS